MCVPHVFPYCSKRAGLGKKGITKHVKMLSFYFKLMLEIDRQ